MSFQHWSSAGQTSNRQSILDTLRPMGASSQQQQSGTFDGRTVQQLAAPAQRWSQSGFSQRANARAYEYHDEDEDALYDELGGADYGNEDDEDSEPLNTRHCSSPAAMDGQGEYEFPGLSFPAQPAVPEAEQAAASGPQQFADAFVFGGVVQSADAVSGRSLGMRPAQSPAGIGMDDLQMPALMRVATDLMTPGIVHFQIRSADNLGMQELEGGMQQLELTTPANPDSSGTGE